MNPHSFCGLLMLLTIKIKQTAGLFIPLPERGRARVLLLRTIIKWFSKKGKILGERLFGAFFFSKRCSLEPVFTPTPWPKSKNFLCCCETPRKSIVVYCARIYLCEKNSFSLVSSRHSLFQSMMFASMCDFFTKESGVRTHGGSTSTTRIKF